MHEPHPSCAEEFGRGYKHSMNIITVMLNSFFFFKDNHSEVIFGCLSETNLFPQ